MCLVLILSGLLAPSDENRSTWTPADDNCSEDLEKLLQLAPNQLAIDYVFVRSDMPPGSFHLHCRGGGQAEMFTHIYDRDLLESVR